MPEKEIWMGHVFCKVCMCSVGSVSLSLEDFDKIAKHKETNIRKNSRNSRFRLPNIFRLYITLSKTIQNNDV